MERRRVITVPWAVVLLAMVLGATAGVPVTSALEPIPKSPALRDRSGQLATVGKWRRHVISISNTTYSGNPFELEIDATFTHQPSGATITLPGYYAGNNIWKIGFMPTRTGRWNWVTDSPDADLDGKTGSLDCVASGLPGMLRADPAHPRKWKFSDGPYVVPVAVRNEVFSEPGSDNQFAALADFLKANNVHMVETRLTELEGQFENGRYDFIFEGDWRNHRFDLRIWDRMERRMEILTQRGLGAHVLFYADAPGDPGWSGKSATEALVIRYAVARLAGYPVLWFNSGIDISEYRSQSDIDWWGNRVQSLDPYDHPISSRRGGGSGSIELAGKTFDSRGDRQSEIGRMADYFETSDVPVSMDDAWGENRPSHPDKNHTPSDIRRAFWKALVAGGVGGLVRGSQGFFYQGTIASDWESEQWVRLVNPFLRDHLGDTFADMVPAPSLVVNGHALADPARSQMVFYTVGSKDTYDSGGGSFTVDLRGVGGSFAARWFDPRTGNWVDEGTLQGGQTHDLLPPSPSNDDWVLLVGGGSAAIFTDSFESGTLSNWN